MARTGLGNLSILNSIYQREKYLIQHFHLTTTKNFHSFPAFFFFSSLFSHFSELKRSCPGLDQLCILEQSALHERFRSPSLRSRMLHQHLHQHLFHRPVVRQSLVCINSTDVILLARPISTELLLVLVLGPAPVPPLPPSSWCTFRYLDPSPVPSKHQHQV